jgi:hypothetical protein
MTNNIPQWIKELKPGQELVISFPNSSNAVMAEVVENYPYNDYVELGTITVRYTWNGVVRDEDLLYDDYGKDIKNTNSWTGDYLT